MKNIEVAKHIVDNALVVAGTKQDTRIVLSNLQYLAYLLDKPNEENTAYIETDFK